MKLRLSLLALAMGTASVQARATTFALDRGTVRLDVPGQWQSAPGLFGMPLVLLGPESPGARRPVLTLTPTGAEAAFDSAALAKEAGAYRAGREAWLKKRGGHSIRYFPYENPSWPGASETHSMGYRYELGGKEFIEHTFYTVCRGRLYHLKTLLEAALEKDRAVELERTARSFACE